MAGLDYRTHATVVAEYSSPACEQSRCGVGPPLSRPIEHGTSLIPYGAVSRSCLDRSLPSCPVPVPEKWPSALEVEKPGLVRTPGRGRLRAVEHHQYSLV